MEKKFRESVPVTLMNNSIDKNMFKFLNLKSCAKESNQQEITTVL